MRKWLVFVLAGGALQAAIIKGSVVENQTGKALARTLISIQPLPGSPGPSLSARTNTYGSFEFAGLPAGSYLLHAARRGFMPVQYGQKNWRASGTPIVLDADQSTFLFVRLPRFASISGIIVDENDVGLPEHEVAAFRNTRPPRLIARAQADDRGIYRIFGLEPGNYLVRTIGRQYEDGGYLPTFFRETQRVEEAGFVETYLDQDRPDIKVRPIPGKLFNISGSVDSYGQPLMVTLVSDVGRETVTTTGAFQFPAHPPGPYELYVEVPSDRRGNQPMGAYMAFSLEHDMTGMRVPLVLMPGLTFQFKALRARSMPPASRCFPNASISPAKPRPNRSNSSTEPPPFCPAAIFFPSRPTPPTCPWISAAVAANGPKATAPMAGSKSPSCALAVTATWSPPNPAASMA